MNKKYSLMNNINIKDNIFIKKLNINNHKYLNISNLKYLFSKISKYDDLYISSSIKNNYLISKYKYCKQLQNIDNINDNTLIEIVQEIRKIHQIEIAKTDNTYLKKINDWFINNIKSNKNHFLKYKSLVDVIIIDENDLVLCHNDLHLQNIKTINGKVKIIDWDFTGINDFHYDLASLCGELKLKKHQIELVCNNYGHNVDINKVYKYIIIEKIINGSWALYWYMIKGEAVFKNIYKDKLKYLENQKTISF